MSGLSGRVSAAGGRPLARAQVQVGEYGFASRFTRADGEGRYQFENLPLGEFQVQAETDGLETVKSKLFGTSGAELSWDPVLGSGLAIRGRLVAHETDFSKWWMYCESLDWDKTPYAQSATPKADGSFEFTGCGDAVHRIRIHAPDAGLFPVATLEARPGAEPLIVPIDSAVLPSCRLRGRIVDEDGAPLAGVQFNPILSAAGFSPIETADAAGRFDLGPVPPGEYGIRIRAKGYAAHQSEKVTLAANASWDFGDLQLQRGGSIAIHLAHPATKPVSIELWRGESSQAWIGIQGDSGRSETLAPGEYELRLWMDGARIEAAVAFPRVTVRVGEETAVELTLP